jgi:hypothetical protein
MEGSGLFIFSLVVAVIELVVIGVVALLWMKGESS